MAIQPFRSVRVNIGGTRRGSAAASGFRAIENNFKSWSLHLTGQSGEVLKQALEPTLAKAKEYCPKKTGRLRESGYLEVARTGFLSGYQAEIGFARGGTPDYAVIVHEVARYHKPPTRWKFLQGAIEEDASAIQQRIANGFKSASGT